jgi:hypothetical protein
MLKSRVVAPCRAWDGNLFYDRSICPFCEQLSCQLSVNMLVDVVKPLATDAGVQSVLVLLPDAMRHVLNEPFSTSYPLLSIVFAAILLLTHLPCNFGHGAHANKEMTASDFRCVIRHINYE